METIAIAIIIAIMFTAAFVIGLIAWGLHIYSMEKMLNQMFFDVKKEFDDLWNERNRKES